MIKCNSISEDHIDLMHYIQNNSNTSQRQMAQKTGLSVGKVNYILKALIDIGFIKIDNFNKSSQKIKYSYILTPKGLKQKADITKQFINIKKQEYYKLNSYLNC